MRFPTLVVVLSLGFAGAATAGEKAPILIKRGVTTAFEITDSDILVKPEGGGLATLKVCNLAETPGEYLVSDIAPWGTSVNGLPPSLGGYSVPPQACATGQKGFDVILSRKSPWSGTIRFD